MLSIIRLPKLKKQSKKLVYNNLKKIIFLLFLCFSYSLNGQSNLLIKEEINGSFSQGTMNGAIDRYFSDDTYYLRSNFNIKIFRLINIKREEGYIVSLKDSTITRINHRKKKFLSIGRKKGFKNQPHETEKMTAEESNLTNVKHKIKKNKISISIILFFVILISLVLAYL